MFFGEAGFAVFFGAVFDFFGAVVALEEEPPEFFAEPELLPEPDFFEVVALEEEPPEFFAEPEKPDEPQVVINQDDLIEIGSQGVSMKLVHNGNPNRTLAMMFETYQPGTTTGERIKHQGEEIGTILEGEVILTINGQTYPLVAGQSYAINTGIPHSFSNTSAGICRIISAHTPTTF